MVLFFFPEALKNYLHIACRVDRQFISLSALTILLELPVV